MALRGGAARSRLRVLNVLWCPLTRCFDGGNGLTPCASCSAEAWLSPHAGGAVATPRHYSVSKRAVLLTKSPPEDHSVSKRAVLLTKSPPEDYSVSKSAVLLTNRADLSGKTPF